MAAYWLVYQLAVTLLTAENAKPAHEYPKSTFRNVAALVANEALLAYCPG